MPIFKGVMTTASVSIVDKALHDGSWKYFDITPGHGIVERPGVTNSKHDVLDYAARGSIWGLRGLESRISADIHFIRRRADSEWASRKDVVPCVTSLRNAPRKLRTLSHAAFQKYFVLTGEKCWLIRSNDAKRSNTLSAYLDHVPMDARQNYTCLNQDPWFKYTPHPVPRILFSSGFTKFGPKILINKICARAVGSVLGIHGGKRISLRRLQGYLLRINFENRVVAHAKN